MGSRNTAVRLVASSVAGMLLATSAGAQSSSPSGVIVTGTETPTEELLTDRFNVDVGAFLVSSNINGNLRGTVQTQTGIDFSHDFGTDADQTRVRANLLWRITRRQGLRFSYFDNDVRKTRSTDRDLTWGDYTFPATTQVTAQNRLRIYELGYEFSFLNERNYKVTGTAGVHVEDFKIALSGNAILTNPDGSTQEVSGATQSNAVIAPLPVLGLRGDWAVTDHWYLDGALQVFKFRYQGIDGNWSDFNAGVTYMFSHHFGVGLAYDRFAVHVDLSKGDFTGRLNLGYQGGLLFVKAGF